MRTYNSLKFDVIVKINFVLANALEVTKNYFCGQSTSHSVSFCDFAKLLQSKNKGYPKSKPTGSSSKRCTACNECGQRTTNQILLKGEVSKLFHHQR